MSIIQEKDYCFVDEEKLWNEIYASSNLRIKNEFYDIWDTFKMDTQKSAASTKKAGNKRGGAEFLASRTEYVKSIWKQFSKSGILKNGEKTAENNKTAREASKNVKSFDWIQRYSKMDTKLMNIVDLEDGSCFNGENAKLVKYQNVTDEIVEVKFDGDCFVIPGNSKFLQGPVDSVKHLDYGLFFSLFC